MDRDVAGVFVRARMRFWLLCLLLACCRVWGEARALLLLQGWAAGSCSKWVDKVGRVTAEGVRAEHCNQFRHVPGCPQGDGRQALPEQQAPGVLRHPFRDGLRFYSEWMLRFGSGVRTRVGDVVVLDARTLQHVLEHNEREAVWRLRNLPLVVETLRNPAEVWQGFRGNKVHIARFRVGERPRVVVAVSHGRRVVTFYAEQNYPEWMDRYRRGKLLYKRREPAT